MKVVIKIFRGINLSDAHCISQFPSCTVINIDVLWQTFWNLSLAFYASVTYSLCTRIVKVHMFKISYALELTFRIFCLPQHLVTIYCIPLTPYSELFFKLVVVENIVSTIYHSPLFRPAFILNLIHALTRYYMFNYTPLSTFAAYLTYTY